MKNKNLNLFRSTKGITLVALVTTIIVLLVLAGITIQFLFNDNGIITNAKYSKNLMELSQVKESLDLYYLNSQLETNSIDPIIEPKLTSKDITDEVTATLVATDQGVSIIENIKYEDLYFLDKSALGLTHLPDKKYFIDITTKIVYINGGMSLKESKVYKVEEYLQNNQTKAEGTKVYAAQNNSYILKQDGSLYGVGEMDLYNPLLLDFLDEYDITETPQKTNIKIIDENVANSDDFIAVYGNTNTYIFEKKNGELWGIGANNYGQLGLGDNIARSELTKLPISHVKDIQISADCIYYLKDDGTIWASGKNHIVQWGTTRYMIKKSDDVYYAIPQKISYLLNGQEIFENIKLFSLGSFGALVVKENGEVWANVGLEIEGKFANNASYMNEPMRCPKIEELANNSNSKIKKVYTVSSTVILLENGDIYTAGYGHYGILGNGATAPINTFYHVNLPAVSDFVRWNRWNLCKKCRWDYYTCMGNVHRSNWSA